MARTAFVAAVLVAVVASAAGKTYFAEKFDDGSWESRWVKATPSGRSKAEMGEFKAVAGKWNANTKDVGLQTSQDARFYSLVAPLDSEVSNEGKTLVVQFTAKHEQSLDCGGGYIKLLPPGIDTKTFSGDTEYRVMFGPDICGTSTRKTHVIFNYKGENHLTKKEPRVETDQLTHLYTLIVRPDNTYEVQIDGTRVEGGDMSDHFDMLPAKTIKDPSASKPADWVDEAKIPDPEDKKPAGWDDTPKQIPDPAAKQPDDWDEEEDGEWESPMIDNPEYKGEWKPRMIDNADFKGPWVHPEIDNPEYFEDDKLHARCDPCGYVGFELWQVKSGTIFDNIMVTDSEEEARAFADETFFAMRDAEKAAFDEEKEEERKAAEEARKAAEEAAKAEEEDEEDEEDEDEEEEDEKDEL